MGQPIGEAAPFPPRTVTSFKPEIIYQNKTSGEIARAINVSIDAVNATLRNLSSRLGSAVATLKPTTLAPTFPMVASSGSSVVTGNNFVMTTTTTAAPLRDGLNTMDTTSLSEQVSQLSMVHLLAWFLLFASMTLLTVVLLNCCLRSQQDAADAAENDGDDEELRSKFAVASSVISQGTHIEGPSSATSSSSRLLPSRGNLARQQFLESRKTGSAVKSYGGTASTSPAK
ncbi:hypothetical protein JIQ42_03001 [Leishmania sp. Namibia]|uniref:hypothetical protein n=1 Tax=Leishmania sp. Namibia TaxID=2802991 RepID=UPI001B7A2F5D|nr:hypothetical protein JIQ42_03001 [Leishmania sp. Namibia]